jgi:light-regulated signal transduction histidine kinase (bacteriophytochrome)
MANDELEAFSYSVSHDLRAPLRAIDGFSRLMLEDHGQELSENAMRYQRLVQANASHMGRLIDDLLTFARLNRQPLTKRTVSPTEIIRQVVEELGEERDGRDVDVQIGELPSCSADPTLLRQVYANLLSNALKFTRNQEHAVIECGWLPENGGGAYFVRDNGVGFEMEFAHKLFGVFQRLHRFEEYEGTGVGLALVDRIIRRHGGRVWAESEPDRGATFCFTV